MNPQHALSKLQNHESQAVQQLARLVVEQTTATKLKDIATPRWIAGQIATALEAATQGELARQWVDRRIETERERWSDEERHLGEFIPEEAEQPLRELLARPYSPDEELVFRIIDHQAVSNLVRLVLTNALTRFGRRMRKLEKGVFGGLGGRAAKRGRRLFGDVTGNLGDIAENIVGAVKEEIDTALEGRVKDFAGQATTEAVRLIAGYLSNPENAAGFGDFRIAVLDVLLDTPISELAEEADKLQPEDLINVVVGAIRSAVSNDDFVDRTENRIAQLLDEAGDGTLGAWLDEVGLREVWTETTTELVASRLQAVVDTEAFEKWWFQLFSDD